MPETTISLAIGPPAASSNTVDISVALTEGLAVATTIDVDDEDLPNDASTLDDRISSYLASLTSSVIDYPEEYGRRYHAYRAGSYQFPNDEREMDRLDFNHYLIAKAIGKIFLTPVEKSKIHRILDVGTGTGIWAIEIGDEFPNSEVVGIDLSAIQPDFVPPNVKFETDDAESSWVRDAKYDFIFTRYLACSIADWPKLIRNIYTSLNNNGWAEFQDYELIFDTDDGTLTDDHETMKWIKLANEVSDKAKDPHYKELRMINLMQLLDGLEAFTLKPFCGMLGWTTEEAEVLLARVRKEMKSGTFHAHMNYHVVYGQKVDSSEEEDEDEEE